MASKTSDAASAIKGKGKIAGGILAAVAVLAIIAIVAIHSGLFAVTDILIHCSEHVNTHHAMQLMNLP